MLIAFWVCLALIGYVYFGYPALLWSGAFGARRRAASGADASLPSISVIVPAHNEESSIEAKIANLFASDYPRERVEILIGSDGSNDKTEDLVRRYEGEGVGLVSFPQQNGKTAVQNGLCALASGEILVFTDADCLFERSTLRHLMEHFDDPFVGLATARPLYQNARETSVTHNEGIYLRYETWLRSEESTRGLLAVASGSLFALRRSLWHPIDAAMGDDFVFPLQVAMAGLRNVLDSRAVAVTRLTQNHSRAMFRMKVRIIGKDFRALLAHGQLLNPLRYGRISLALWSHKLLRWLVPYFLIGLAMSDLFLARATFFRACFVAQILFYFLALCGVALGVPGRRLFSVPASFCLVNLAALYGTLGCLAGYDFGRWTPVRVSSPFSSRGETP